MCLMYVIMSLYFYNRTKFFVELKFTYKTIYYLLIYKVSFLFIQIFTPKFPCSRRQQLSKTFAFNFFRMRLITFLVVVVISVSSSHQGAQYLNKAVRDLRQLNVYQTLRRADVDMLSSSPEVEREVPLDDSTSRRDATSNEVKKANFLLVTLAVSP